MKNKFKYSFGHEYKIITLSTKVADKQCIEETILINELVERREFLCKNVPSCEYCSETKQIQLRDWSCRPAEWKCRTCERKWFYEPKIKRLKGE